MQQQIVEIKQHKCWIGKLANIHFVCYFKTSINEKIHMKKKTWRKIKLKRTNFDSIFISSVFESAILVFSSLK